MAVLFIAMVIVTPGALLTARAAHATGGGPVILDGMDPGNHGGLNGGGGLNGPWIYIGDAYQNLMAASSYGTAGHIAVLGAADSTASSADCGAGAHFAAAADGYTATYYPTAADIDTFFSELAAGTLPTVPRLIHIVDAHCTNGLNTDLTGILAALSANSTVIANFVNSGGALFANTESSSSTAEVGYEWLTTLLPGVTVTDGTGSAPVLSAAGLSAFPGLTNADIASPWHSHFAGTLGPLQVLATQSGSNIIVGGASVLLPSAVTLSPTSTLAGINTTDTVTAAVVDTSSNPVAGAVVSYSVTSGPNIGETGTGTTSSNGTTTFTYTGGATTGTDTVQASVTVAGILSITTTTIQWATIPTAPTVTSVTAEPGALTVAFTAPMSNGGATITGYTVTVNGTAIQQSGATSPITVSGLTPGTPYAVEVFATNGIGNGTSSEASTAVAPTAFFALSVTPPTGEVGAAYAVTFTPIAGTPTFSWAVTGSLPEGLTLDPETGILSGTPTAPGTYPFTVTVTGSDEVSVTDTVSVTVIPVPVVTAPTTTVPPAPVTVPVAPVPLPAPTVLVPTGGSTAATPQGAGYWALATGGQLSNHGNAGDFGSENTDALNGPIVAINATTTGKGYWLAATDGGVFSFGDATFHGSLGGQHLDGPIVAIASTPDNGGYRLAASDGGVFDFGDATFHGSMADTPLNQPVVSMVSTPDGKGYWLAASDGGVFSFGDATFEGSLGAIDLDKHIVGIATTPDGKGYWLVAADGGVFTFGDAKFFGSLGGTGTTDIVGMVADANVGYRLITAAGGAVPFGTTPS